MEAFSLLDLPLLNNEKKPTFVRGEASSIDLAFVRSDPAKGNNCWEVSEIYTLSDHRTITWSVRRQQRPKNRQSQLRKKKFSVWKASAFDTGSMRASIERSCAEGLTVEEKVEDVMQKVANTCDAAMPKKESPTRLSTGGASKSRSSMRSATERGGYHSGLKGNPPSRNWRKRSSWHGPSLPKL